MVKNKSQKKLNKNKFLMPILYVLIVIALLVISFFIYRVIPSTSKINGTWYPAEEAPYTLTIEDKKFVCKEEKYSGQEDMTLVMEGDIVSDRSEKYKGKNVIVYLEIDKANFSQKAVEEMKNVKNQYKVIKDDKVLRLQFLPETVFDAFKIEDADKLFNFSIFHYKNGLFVDEIRLQNQAFAKDSIVFEKAE